MYQPKLLGSALALLLAANANAQLFAPQNPNGPRGAAEQKNYPYPGQCVTSTSAFPWGVGQCDASNAKSFLCEPSGLANQTAGGWRSCGAVTGYTPLLPVISDSSLVAPAIPTPKFQWEVLNPLDYTPDTTTFPGADYYEIGLHEANGFQGIASAGLFPNPQAAAVPGPAVPAGMQWTGLVCTNTLGCACPPEMKTGPGSFGASYCSAGGKVPPGAPLLTPIWGIGQINKGGGPVTSTLSSLGLYTPGTPTAWSANNYVATWPSISIRATKGRPVVVRYVNEFPNNHVFCPHPEAADWPCAIDRTFMGVKARIDPASVPPGFGVSPDGVNQFGSPQQPDNSWVTHLHGGDIPPSTDGFALKWFGNKVTGPLYSPNATNFASPGFEGPPSAANVKRPGGPYSATSIQSSSNDTYTYPMNQDEALIWFHDHTLGKTHHNVIAGPAGFFPVKDPTQHGPVKGGVCSTTWTATPGNTCDYTWLDPVTEPRGALGIPKYDLFFAVQDRAFNEDGSINFSNGIGQGASSTQLNWGLTPSTDTGGVVNGVNPDVHPTWVPEYFGDHALVNGVIWPKKTVDAGWHRIRFADGSDSRCWTVGFSTTLPAPGTKPVNNVKFTVIASDQGYLPVPKQAVANFTMCPGERYEIMVDFGKIPGRVAGAAGPVYMTNSAAAPYPAGNTPWAAPIAPATFNPDREMNVMMRFDVNGVAGVPTCNATGLTYNAAVDANAVPWVNKGCIKMPVIADPDFVDLRKPPFFDVNGNPVMCAPLGAGTAPNCVSAVRQLYLNERADGLTLFPMGMQLNGVPFEYKVTETPRVGTVEVWKIINLTVDAHPMHPHLVKHQRVSTQKLNVGAYKRALCGSTTCQPGTAPGGEMQLVPDVDAIGPTGVALYTTAAPVLQLSTDWDGGYKDASIALPGQVTTIVARWQGAWNASGTANAPGTVASASCLSTPGSCGVPYVYEPVTLGPYVWHCHINSHEDSEMMRTSLVVP